MEKLYKYPIKVVSQVTGLSAFVIRAWEKDMMLLPHQERKLNRRLYSEEDIERLIYLMKLLKKDIT